MYFKKTLLILTTLALSACASTSLSTENPSSSHDGSLFKSEWGDETVENAIENSIQYDIPYFYAPKYEVETGIDVYNDPYLNLYFLGFKEDEAAQKAEAYASVCRANGYKVDFDTSYADGLFFDLYTATIDIGDGYGMMIQIVSGANDAGEIGVLAYATPYVIVDGLSFPMQLIEHYLNITIPKFEKDYFTYYGEVLYDSSLGLIYVYLEIQNALADDEDEYKTILEDSNYLIDASYYEDYGYIACDKDDTHIIQFSYLYGSIGLYVYNV